MTTSVQPSEHPVESEAAAALAAAIQTAGLPKVDQKSSFMWAIAQAARLQGTEIDRLQLHALVTQHANEFDNIETGRYLHPALTTVDQPRETIAELLAECGVRGLLNFS